MKPIKTVLAICIARLGIVVSNASAEPALVIKVDERAVVIFDGDGNLASLLCASMRVETNSETGVTNILAVEAKIFQTALDEL